MITDKRIIELWNAASNAATSKLDWTYSEIIFATVRAVIAEHDVELRKQEPVAWMARSGSGTTVLPDERMNKDYYNIPLYTAPIPPDNHDWKAEYLRQVDLHNQTLDELREAEMQLRNPAPTPPTPSQQEAQWQPIETAPKDGRELILLLTPSKFPQIAYSNTWWTSGFSVECQPTHWMPLPTRPDEVTK